MKGSKLYIVSICTVAFANLIPAVHTKADSSLDVAATAANFQEILCTQFPDRSSGSQAQELAGEWIYDTLTDAGCTVYIANSKKVQGEYIDTSASSDDSLSSEQADVETDIPEAPTGTVFLDGIPYVCVPTAETSENETSENETSESGPVETVATTSRYISPLTADNYIVHFDGTSDESIFLACYYDTAAEYTSAETPADTGTSAVALLMALSTQFKADDIHPLYNIDIGFFDDSAKARAGEYQFFDAVSPEYRNHLTAVVEFDCLIGDRNCLYNASNADQFCNAFLTASARMGTGFLMLTDTASEEALAEASATPITMLQIPTARIEASRWFDSDQKNVNYSTYGTHLYQSSSSSLYNSAGQISGTESEYYENYCLNTELVDRYSARCTDIYLTLSAFLSY